MMMMMPRVMMIMMVTTTTKQREIFARLHKNGDPLAFAHAPFYNDDKDDCVWKYSYDVNVAHNNAESKR